MVREFAKPPSSFREEIEGLEEAISNTKRKIEESKTSNFFVSELVDHLTGLNSRVQELKKISEVLA